jgi:hypothetical protein
MGTIGSFTSLLERIADRFTVGDGCWEWSGSRSAAGYGNVWVDGRQRYAHRVMYELLVGPIPAGLQIDHLCRNRSCVNPGHMEPVTSKENTLRGNSMSARHARQTECPHGHSLSDAMHYKNGRSCRTCADLRNAAKRQAREEARCQR